MTNKLAFSKNNSVQESQNAVHVLPGGSGGPLNTPITSWPHTLATHISAIPGTAYSLPSGRCTVQATASLNGGVSIDNVVINIEVSNDNSSWLTAGSFSFTAVGSDGFVIDAPWAYIRSDADTFTVTGMTPQVVVTLMI